MFAVFALVAFVVALIERRIEGIDVAVLGLAFLAVHLVVPGAGVGVLNLPPRRGRE